ncbi:hypothetical protein [Arthrobacter sp. Br18]|uniref:hypothetical protein n=1 Tax=Arthrobacter sp. Br18 TaxID=1312954 RepID=UPI00047E199C|nr:hypothetical protein [Arthrobacter sp. Br18]
MTSGENAEGWAFSDEEAAREGNIPNPELPRDPDPAIADKAKTSQDQAGQHAPAVEPDESANTASEYPSQPEAGKPSSDQSERYGYQNDADPPR